MRLNVERELAEIAKINEGYLDSVETQMYLRLEAAVAASKNKVLQMSGLTEAEAFEEAYLQSLDRIRSWMEV